LKDLPLGSLIWAWLSWTVAQVSVFLNGALAFQMKDIKLEWSDGSGVLELVV